MVLVIQPDPLKSVDSVDIAIILGEPENWDRLTAFQLGWEDIVMIASGDSGINLENLETIQEEFTATPPVNKIWTYPLDHPLQKIFNSVILGNQKTTPYAFIAPNPKAMIDSIRLNPPSIGYIPGSWMNEDAKIIAMDPSIQKTLRIPILALTIRNTDMNNQKFIACLQDNWIKH